MGGVCRPSKEQAQRWPKSQGARWIARYGMGPVAEKVSAGIHLQCPLSLQSRDPTQSDCYHSHWIDPNATKA